MGHAALIAVWAAALVGQVYLWGILDHPQGNSIPFLVTYSMGLLLATVTLAWWILFAPFPWRTIWVAAIPALALLIGFVAAVRRPDFTGDLRARLVFRWERLPEEVREEYQRRAPAPTVGPADLSVPEITPQDMAEYRGRHRDGVVEGPPLRQDWGTNPPVEMWRRPVGGGYSSFAVVDNLAVTLEQLHEDEAVVCYLVDSGAVLWERRYRGRFDEAMGGPGPRSTPTIHGDAVYTVGALGDVHCLDLLSGAVRWHVNMLQQFELPNATWGMAGSPLIVDELVIVNPGGAHGNGLAAYRVSDGELVWISEGLAASKGEPTGSGQTSTENFASYSSPMLATLHGVRVILNFDGIGLHAVELSSGKRLWFWEFRNSQANVAQPIVFDDGRVLISASYGKGSAMIATHFDPHTNAWDVADAWNGKTMALRSKFSSPVAYAGDVYGLDEGIMVCLDGKTGERLWKGSGQGLRGRYGHGQMLLINSQILVLSERGELVLIDPAPDALKELGSIKVLPGHKTWNPPAYSRGRLLVRNDHEMACYDLRVVSSVEPEQPATAQR